MAGERDGTRRLCTMTGGKYGDRASCLWRCSGSSADPQRLRTTRYVSCSSSTEVSIRMGEIVPNTCRGECALRDVEEVSNLPRHPPRFTPSAVVSLRYSVRLKCTSRRLGFPGLRMTLPDECNMLFAPSGRDMVSASTKAPSLD